MNFTTNWDELTGSHTSMSAHTHVQNEFVHLILLNSFNACIEPDSKYVRVYLFSCHSDANRKNSLKNTFTHNENDENLKPKKKRFTILYWMDSQYTEINYTKNCFQNFD